jgi:23S rRNA G2069 N7-methylase RlmK/C1962 C5-methylase RlmI
VLSLDGADAFAARLARQLKERRGWASRNRVSCFRVYDREEDEFPFIIDLYEDRLVWFLVSDGDEEIPEELLAMAAEATGVDRSRFRLKTRRRQRGTDQYEKQDDAQELVTVREGGLKFQVNLTDYLDTGLFLDHRWTRAYVRELAAGKKVLNLFCYTGSFTAYAAQGNAFETVSVDLNQNYLDWAQTNLELNGLAGPRHRLVRRDAVEYLRTETKPRFDVIVLDPPTFSNSKKMEGTFDVQRDHPALIARCLKLLSEDGVLVFSTNAQKFRFDAKALPPCRAVETTSFTVPLDCKKTAHRSWFITAVQTPELRLKKLEMP